MGGAPASLHTLVADDAPSVGRAMQRVLRRWGHRVSLAHDGAAALDIDLHDPADLLITDMNMPRLDGIGLIRHIRERRPGLPIILMTGGDASGVPAAAAAGIDRIVLIRKPMTTDELSSDRM